MWPVAFEFKCLRVNYSRCPCDGHDVSSRVTVDRRLESFAFGHRISAQTPISTERVTCFPRGSLAAHTFPLRRIRFSTSLLPATCFSGFPFALPRDSCLQTGASAASTSRRSAHALPLFLGTSTEKVSPALNSLIRLDICILSAIMSSDDDGDTFHERLQAAVDLAEDLPSATPSRAASPGTLRANLTS